MAKETPAIPVAVTATYETLTARGVKFKEPVAIMPWGAKATWFSDIDGKVWAQNNGFAGIHRMAQGVKKRALPDRLHDAPTGQRGVKLKQFTSHGSRNAHLTKKTR